MPERNTLVTALYENCRSVQGREGKMMFDLRSFTFAFVLVAATTSPKTHGDVFLKHVYDTQIGTYACLDGECQILSKDMTVTIPKGQSVKVRVENPNPFLFIYDASDVSLVDMPDVEALSAFGKGLTDFISKLSPVVPAAVQQAPLRAGQSCTIAYEGFDVLNAPKILASAIDQYEALPAQINDTFAATPPTERLKVDLDLIKAIKQMATAVRDARAAAISNQSVRIAVNGAMKDLTFDNLANPSFLHNCQGQTAQFAANAWSVFWESRIDVNEWAKLATAFSLFNSALEELSLPVALKTPSKEDVSYAYDWSKQLEFKVNLRANPLWTSLLSDRARRLQMALSGAPALPIAYPVTLAPERRWRLAISPGLIYSFVDQSAFTAQDNGEDAFLIAQTTKKSAKLGGSIALNVYPERYYGSAFSPFLQFGVASVEDEAIMLGLGTKIGGQVTFALGAVYQKVDELGAGLSVGDVVSAEEDVVVTDDFKSGFYLNLSFDVDL